MKELKIWENRVGLTPEGVKALVKSGHKVLVESDAGENSGFSNEDYKKAGAIITNAKEVWDKSEMIVKVKEPIEKEYNYLKKSQVLFTYLHLAADKKLTENLLKKKVTGIAYETVELGNGDLPLLAPMSEVAGKLATQVGAHYLERTYGGFGKLLSSVANVPPAKVTIIGTGIVGLSACKIAHGMGAYVTMIGRNPVQLKNIQDTYHGEVKTLMSNPENIAKAVSESDLLIGAVYITGEHAPKLVTKEMIKKMKKGSVIVDVAIDQGGCVETSRPTTHKNPVYLEEGVIHYCVTNMPAAVPHTSTIALTNATLPYVLKIANLGFAKAIKSDESLAKGVNTFNGKLTYEGVAKALNLKYEKLKI